MPINVNQEFELLIFNLGRRYFDFLSAAFQVPKFLVAKIDDKGNGYEWFADEIYDRILSNWAWEDIACSRTLGMAQLRNASDFLFALAGGMRTQLEGMNGSAMSHAHPSQHRGRLINFLHHKVMAEWLAKTSVTTIVSLGNCWQEVLQNSIREDHAISTMVNSKCARDFAIAWSLIHQHEDGRSFRQLYKETLMSINCGD